MENGVKTVVVLAGGYSSEHEISLASGQTAFAAFEAAGYRTLFVKVERSGYSLDGKDVRIEDLGADYVFNSILIPKIGAVISSMPLPVLGGGVIVMFGMVAAAGMNMLTEVKMSRRNMIIISVSLAVGLGLNLVPSAVQYLPGIWKTLATSAVAPTALLAVVLNLMLPQDD